MAPGEPGPTARPSAPVRRPAPGRRQRPEKSLVAPPNRRARPPAVRPLRRRARRGSPSRRIPTRGAHPVALPGPSRRGARLDAVVRPGVGLMAVVGPCLVWPGRLNQRGYGARWADGRTQKAHRFVYELVVGPIPAGLELDHLCPQPSLRQPGPSGAGDPPGERPPRRELRGAERATDRVQARPPVHPGEHAPGGVESPMPDLSAGASPGQTRRDPGRLRRPGSLVAPAEPTHGGKWSRGSSYVARRPS